MLKERDILELIKNGENSYIEFKEDTVSNKRLTREMIAFSNHRGGIILLGVDDNGNIVGMTRDDNNDRIFNLCTDLIMPRINPSYYEIVIGNKRVGIIEIENGYNKPYFIEERVTIDGKRQTVKVFYNRYGAQTKEITDRDELQRLFQSSKNIHYEIIPVSNSRFDDFERGFLEQYFEKFRKIDLRRKSFDEVENVLSNLDLIDRETKSPTIAGLLLFGENVSSFLPQAGVRVIHVSGREKSDEKVNHKVFESGILRNIENTMNYLYIANRHEMVINGVRRKDLYDYPLDALREIVVNAFAHRDYTIMGSKIYVWIFDDRIEITSPGRIPNTITKEGMKLGIAYHRNPVIMKFLYDAGLVEQLGQGIPRAIKLLEENGNPEMEIEEFQDQLTFVIYKRMTDNGGQR
ncbi:MAG: putative DNA binding domain-containing protein [Candidatus Eremiobacteraeota bacterium]|nr:putative DNA binding domain-containing protein [Candidatus Eremiobacteraeota bacterium]